MIKIGIFVEGQTERIFVEKLLREYVGSSHLELMSVKSIGERIIIITKGAYCQQADYYFLLFDASGDARVVSAMLDRAEGMIRGKSYNKIIGLRDLHPHGRAEKQRVINSALSKFQTTSVANKLRIILAVMEIESWFLVDPYLFGRLHQKLTCQLIKQRLNIDLATDSPESYPRPSQVVRRILALCGHRYKKTKQQVSRICSNIDFAFLCCTPAVHQRISSFKHFLDCIDEELDHCS